MKSGRKSLAELSIVPGRQPAVSQPAPADLGAAGRPLWNAIVASRPSGFFSPADLPLLAEYCRNMAIYLPRLNAALEETYSAPMLYARDQLVRQSAALARSLRLCVSARTAPDTAAMRDSVKPVTLNGWSTVLEEETPA
jgi:hypothetical protein